MSEYTPYHIKTGDRVRKVSEPDAIGFAYHMSYGTSDAVVTVQWDDGTDSLEYSTGLEKVSPAEET